MRLCIKGCSVRKVENHCPKRQYSRHAGGSSSPSTVPARRPDSSSALTVPPHQLRAWVVCSVGPSYTDTDTESGPSEGQPSSSDHC